MPPKLRNELAKFDANGDGFLDIDELDLSAVAYENTTQQVCCCWLWNPSKGRQDPGWLWLAKEKSEEPPTPLTVRLRLL